MIEFKKVSYTHKKGSGVNNLSLILNDGDFSFLIGPTGSGKTIVYFEALKDLPCYSSDSYCFIISSMVGEK